MGDGHVVYTSGDWEVDVPMRSRSIPHRFYVMDTQAVDFVLGADLVTEHPDLLSLKPKEEELSEECVCEPPRVCLCCFACTEGLNRCLVLSCPVPRRQTQIIPLVCYSKVLKGAAVEVPWEHDDSVVLGLLAFTRRLIDMPGRANGIWSRTKQITTLKQRRGRLVLSRTQSGLPPPPETKVCYCQPRFCLYASPDPLSCTVPPCPTQADTNHTTYLLLK